MERKCSYSAEGNTILFRHVLVKGNYLRRQLLLFLKMNTLYSNVVHSLNTQRAVLHVQYMLHSVNTTEITN